MLEYITNINDGLLQKNVSKQIAEDLKKLKGRFLIKITKLGATRSIRQNSYIHALFTIFSKEMIDYTGDEMYTPTKIKNMMKTQFLMRDVISEKTGLVAGKEVLRTRDLSKEDFNIFVEQIIRHASMEYQIVLPYPSEKLELELA